MSHSQRSPWLIEQQYAIVPFVLWLVFREHRGRVLEYANLALWLVLAVCVMAGMLGGRYFSLTRRDRSGPAFPNPDR